MWKKILALYAGQILACLNWISPIALLFFRRGEFPTWCFVRGRAASSGHCVCKTSPALGYFHGEIVTPLWPKSSSALLSGSSGGLNQLPLFVPKWVGSLCAPRQVFQHSLAVQQHPLQLAQGQCSTSSQVDVQQILSIPAPVFCCGFVHSALGRGSDREPSPAKPKELRQKGSSGSLQHINPTVEGCGGLFSLHGVVTGFTLSKGRGQRFVGCPFWGAGFGQDQSTPAWLQGGLARR